MVRCLMDEVFPANSFLLISLSRTTTPRNSISNFKPTTDYLVWYARDKAKIKYRQLYSDKIAGEDRSKRIMAS
jgi:adenine-specific DNA-methyltransferase